MFRLRAYADGWKLFRMTDIVSPSETPEQRWLPMDVAAESVGVSTKTVSRMIARGQCKYRREGKLVLIDVLSMPGSPTDEDPMVAIFNRIIALVKQSQDHTEQAWKLVESVSKHSLQALSEHAGDLRGRLKEADGELSENAKVVREALDTHAEREAALTLLFKDEARKDALAKFGIAALIRHFAPESVNDIGKIVDQMNAMEAGEAAAGADVSPTEAPTPEQSNDD